MKKALILIFILIFLTSCTSNNNSIKYGVLSDIHGDINNLNYFLKKFQKENLDGILILGDSVLNEHLYGLKDTKDDSVEMKEMLDSVLQAFPETPIYIVPGNHETNESYTDVINQVKQNNKNSNLIDMNSKRYIDGDVFDILSLPGYYIGSPYMEDEGYFISGEMMQNVSKFVTMADSPVLFISHGPPKGVDKNSVDYVDLGPRNFQQAVSYANNGQNVGSEEMLNEIKESGIKFGLFGHIHEAYGATDISGNRIEEGKFVDELLFNPGSVKDGRAGLVEIKNGKIKFDIVNS